MEIFKKTVENHPSIMMVWHNRLAILPNFFWDYCPKFDYTAFVSESRDGQWLAKAIESAKNGFTIRVPGEKKQEAVRAFIKAVRPNNILIITPDGPKGPRYEVKPGIAFSAKASKAKVIPFSWSASKFWRVSSWDRTLFPKPFSKIVFEFGEPIDLDKKQSREESIELLKNKLNELKDSVTMSL